VCFKRNQMFPIYNITIKPSGLGIDYTAFDTYIPARI
jgi:hypothetical protein